MPDPGARVDGHGGVMLWCGSMFGIGVREIGLVCLLVGADMGCADDGSGDGGTTTLVGDGSSSSGGPANAAPTVLAEVDLEWACSQDDVTRVELQATRVGCVNPPPAPCTLPQMPRPVVGEGADCPSASPQTLRVELEQAGRYHVELVRLAGEAELRRVCFGEDGGEELLVTEADLERTPTFTVALLDGMPCG